MDNEIETENFYRNLRINQDLKKKNFDLEEEIKKLKFYNEKSNEKIISLTNEFNLLKEENLMFKQINEELYQNYLIEKQLTEKFFFDFKKYQYKYLKISNYIKDLIDKTKYFSEFLDMYLEINSICFTDIYEDLKYETISDLEDILENNEQKVLFLLNI